VCDYTNAIPSLLWRAECVCVFDARENVFVCESLAKNLVLTKRSRVSGSLAETGRESPSPSSTLLAVDYVSVYKN